MSFNPDKYYRNKLSLTEIRKIKDLQAKKFLSRSQVYETKTGKMLDDLKNVAEKSKAHKVAEMMNYINSFVLLADEMDLVLCFVTTTLKAEFHNPVSPEDIKKGFLALKRFQYEIRKDRLFREPTEKYMRQQGVTVAWKWIRRDEFMYIRMKEFHNDWTIHDHTAYLIPTDCVIDFIDLLYRKRELVYEIGRMEVAIPHHIKSEVLDAFF